MPGLEELYKRYLNGQASAAEVEEWRSLLKLAENRERALLIFQEVYRMEPFADITEEQAQSMLQHILLIKQQALPTAGLKPVAVSSIQHGHFLKTSWFRYAAVVILVLGVVAYFWTAHNGSTTSTRLTTSTTLTPSSGLAADIAPGRNRAVLTLANGQQIMLDSIQGNIVQEGNLKVINRSGKLGYEGIGTKVEYHTLSTPKGGQYQLLLPDGSKVWLNAASSISYPTTFTGKDRTVSITGEAYFEVVREESKIFHVKTPKENITVLGTNFNVNAYSDEAATKTSLLEGAIKIGNFIMRPGQAYTNGKIVQADLKQELAWKEGLFNFNNADLPTVMRQLERWYDIKVMYDGPIKQTYNFGGELERSLNLSQVLGILTRMGIKLKMEGRILTVIQ